MSAAGRAGQRGTFITFEGGEGAGKSTQIARLADWLAGQGRDVVRTREPGGSPGAENIRALLVTGRADRWTPSSELFLLAAARADHLARTIEPALARGAVVLCDRFFDSTTAYQGYGHGLDLETVEAVHAATVGPTRPDLTLILDLPLETGLERARARAAADGSSEDRFENMDLGFHERLREGFRAIAAREPQRCAVIDASGDIETVAAAIRQTVTARLGLNVAAAGGPA